MKIAEINPAFKKFNNSEDNHGSISTLTTFIKLFESIHFAQMNSCMQNEFSKYHTGFGKIINMQSCLLRLIEYWKVIQNNGSKVGVIIMDSSKAFNSLNHELLLTKLKAYGSDNNLVIFMKNYLTNRLQRCKINTSFSVWEKVLVGVLQRSVLGALLFNIILNDIFFITSEVSPCKLC